MLPLRLLLLILAIVCFGLGAIQVTSPPVNFVALGLFFATIAMVVQV